ncbi:MAG: SpoIIE family protein phosphatase [Bacteroidales bacterium]|nr:SpoIIE family protein phosphatase [Bacteroidales bacterium]
MKKIIAQILFFTILLKFGVAQNTPYVENYSIEDGLSQNAVTCIFQSSDGIIWLGTQDGLNEFDGYRFNIFKFNPNDSSSISNNYINDIIEDNKGNIIIATSDGITIWERYKNNYIWLQNDPSDPNSINNDDVLQVIFFENTIWALTENSLEKYLGDGKFKHYFFKTDTATTRYIYNHMDLMVDNENNIWLATKDGINIFYPQTEQFYQIKGVIEKISNNRLRSVVQDNQNNIWVGTYMGFNRFMKTSSKFLNYYYYNQNRFIRENTINCVYIDEENYFWIGTKSGLKTFDGSQIIDINNKNLNAITEQITTIYKDNSNNIWCGTLGAGVYKFSTNKTKFSSFFDFFKPADNAIFGIYVDNANRIWAGSNGIYVIDKNSNKIIHYDDLLQNDTTQEITVYSIFKDSCNIWLGTDYSVFIIDPESFKINEIYDYFNIPVDKLMTNNRIYNINKDNEGIYWFSSANGLIEFDGKRFTVHKNLSHNNNSISSNLVISTLITGDSIWITTIKGLNLYNKKTKEFKHWFKKNGLPNDYCLDLYFQNSKTLWITTISGLVKFELDKNTFTSFSSLNKGFVNDFFYTITPDDSNNLWLTSNYGVVKFNTQTYNYITYDKSDGLSFLECNIGGSYKNDDNTLYVSGINGVSWTNLDEVETIMKPAKVNITKFVISNQNFETQEVYFPDTNKVYKFDYKSIINIYFYLPDYVLPERNKFVYKIDGLNDDWSDEQFVNFINITGLSPGKYTLYIKGANSKGVWNNEPIKFTFEITPPWSKSLTFKIIYFILGFILLALGFLYVYRSFKKENKILHEKNFALEQVENQRKLLEEKNKNITDSINYAKKIIEAILPPIENLKTLLPESFIYFKPKDIVSGDFYWFIEKSDRIFIAAVDCTGHGIPGAFMSIIGMNLLDRLVNEGIFDPGVILNLMNKEVISTLKKKFDQKHIKDGMDLSLCVIDKTRKILSFTGAYNPAYIVRDKSIIQLRGDRKSVGNDFEFDSFTTQDLKLRENDTIYLFSDGYTDQFGGISGKKFKFKRFRTLLLSINDLPLELQKSKLHEAFYQWKIDYEQIDDILVIGFKPLSFLG